MPSLKKLKIIIPGLFFMILSCFLGGALPGIFVGILHKLDKGDSYSNIVKYFFFFYDKNHIFLILWGVFSISIIVILLKTKQKIFEIFLIFLMLFFMYFFIQFNPFISLAFIVFSTASMSALSQLSGYKKIVFLPIYWFYMSFLIVVFIYFQWKSGVGFFSNFPKWAVVVFCGLFSGTVGFLCSKRIEWLNLHNSKTTIHGDT